MNLPLATIRRTARRGTRLLSFAPAPRVRAATRNWTAGDGNWSEAENWPPAGAGAEARFLSPDGAARPVTHDYAGSSVLLGAMHLGLANGGGNTAELAIGARALSTATEHVGESLSGAGGGESTSEIPEPATWLLLTWLVFSKLAYFKYDRGS